MNPFKLLEHLAGLITVVILGSWILWVQMDNSALKKRTSRLEQEARELDAISSLHTKALNAHTRAIRAMGDLPKEGR